MYERDKKVESKVNDNIKMNELCVRQVVSYVTGLIKGAYPDMFPGMCCFG